MDDVSAIRHPSTLAWHRETVPDPLETACGAVLGAASMMLRAPVEETPLKNRCRACWKGWA